jgi:anti-sigma factor RsiW
MRDLDHPTPDLLLRFLLGETSKSESRAIVRHLVAGCPACAAVLRPIWVLGDRRARGPAAPQPAHAKTLPPKLLHYRHDRGTRA